MAEAHRGAVAPSSLSGFDFKGFYSAATRLNHGLPLYTLTEDPNSGPLYVFPPLLAEILRPVAMLSFSKALEIWFFINAICVVGATQLISFSRKGVDRLLSASIAMIVFFRIWPMTFELGLGNVNCILLFCVAGMYFAISRKNDRLFIAVLVCGSLVKTWFILFAGYFAFTRQWKKLLLSTLMSATLIIASIGGMGIDQLKTFVCLTLSFVGAQQHYSEPPQSLIGFARMHFHENPYLEPISTNPAFFWAILGVGMLLVLAGMVYAFRTPAVSTQESHLKFALFTCSLLLALPICDLNYLVLATPALLFLMCPTDISVFKQARPFVIALLGSILYLIGMRLSWPCASPIPPSLKHGANSFLISAGTFWLSGLWMLLVLSLQLFRQRVFR